MTKVELQRALRERGLPISGFDKQVLIDRLEDWILDQEAGPSESPAKKVPCTEICLRGKGSICPNRKLGKMTRRWNGKNMLACLEVERMLNQMGVDPKDCSRCILSAIQFGHIEITGQAEDLETVVYDGKAEEGFCDHNFTVKLGDVLFQGDFGGNDYMNTESDLAKVICRPCKGKEERADFQGHKIGHFYFLTNVCMGAPRLDSGKFHHHCVKCSDYGMCVDDYRETHCDSCGSHDGWRGACFNKGCRNRSNLPDL